MVEPNPYGFASLRDRVMLLVGLVGLVVSAWLAFAFYVDTVLGDTMRQAVGQSPRSGNPG